MSHANGVGRILIGAALVMAVTTPLVLNAASFPGAIFTTNVACDGTNINIFGAKTDVYLDGGPAHIGAAGLPDGQYYVRITEPDGTLLGTSIGSASPTPATVSNGKFVSCYQLWTILIKASDSTQGFDTTTNGGGEYKVWISMDSTFPNDGSKTDNFKVKEQPTAAELRVTKFYDANANGVNDDNQPITGWRIQIQDDLNFTRFTPVDVFLDPGSYVVVESAPAETNWLPTTTNPVNLILAAGGKTTVEFGNLCLGAGSGKTLGFWSNRNGQAILTPNDTAWRTLLTSLNLRRANGTGYDVPAGTFTFAYSDFRSWILGATATNMAYMLSAQLAAMQLNVAYNGANPASLIYAPGSLSANALGFAPLGLVMAEANTSLGANGYTVAAGAVRTYQEALKNALDKANNNLTFVQPTPCAFTFAQ